MPTSSDIYLEKDGQKVAVAQSYIGRLRSGKYDITLARVYVTDDAIQSGFNFHDLDDFKLIICKPDRRITYSGCQWNAISETGTLDSMEIDHMIVTAKERREEAPHEH